MALMDRHATSLLMVDSERVWTFDKAVRLGCIRDLDAPNYEIGDLSDSIRECGHSRFNPLCRSITVCDDQVQVDFYRKSTPRLTRRCRCKCRK